MTNKRGIPAKKGRKVAKAKKGAKKVVAKNPAKARAKPSKAKPPTGWDALAAERQAFVASTMAALAAASVSAPPQKRWHHRFRSAINGWFVSMGFAKKHPDTTVRERA
jgi:hypothetical protein